MLLLAASEARLDMTFKGAVFWRKFHCTDGTHLNNVVLDVADEQLFRVSFAER